MAATYPLQRSRIESQEPHLLMQSNIPLLELLSVDKQEQGKSIMKTNAWRAPDHDYMKLAADIAMQFSSVGGGAIDPMAFFLDPQAALAWCARANESTYADTFSSLPPHWTTWAIDLILRHLRQTSLDQTRIDVLGLGVGDGRKETTLCESLVQQRMFEQVTCMLLDISPGLAAQAHTHFTARLGTNPAVKGYWGLGNYHNLPRYKDLFYAPGDENTLKVGTLFDVIQNVRHEISFIEQSLRAFKTGDLIIVDSCLGYASPDEPERIRQEDPSLTFLGDSAFRWYRGVIKRYCPQAENIDLQFQLKYGLSTIRNSYTVEISAIVDHKTHFSIMQKHRYLPDDFAAAFESRGWKSLGRFIYGLGGRQMLHMFLKK